MEENHRAGWLADTSEGWQTEAARVRTNIGRLQRPKVSFVARKRLLINCQLPALDSTRPQRWMSIAAAMTHPLGF